MTVVISQSMYFPWAGLIEQARLADIFVHYDDVQYARGFLNRVQIKTSEGIQWMTVPLAGLKRGQLISEVQVQERDEWRLRHRAMLIHSYAKTPHCEEMLELFDGAISCSGESLADLSRSSLVALATHPAFGATCRFLDSRSLAVPGCGSKRILDIVKTLGGTTYITGQGGRNYLDHQAFVDEGIDVRYMKYSVGPYPQRFGEFTPYVSALDILANCGKEASPHLRSTTMDWREMIL